MNWEYLARTNQRTLNANNMEGSKEQFFAMQEMEYYESIEQNEILTFENKTL
jgi:hypothetical protein